MKQPYPLKKFKTRLIGTLCLMILIASAISFAGSLALNNQTLLAEIEEDQRGVAVYALELRQKTSLSVSEIAAMSTTAIYQVEAVSDPAAEPLSDAQRAILKQGEVAALKVRGYSLPVTFFMAGDTLMRVSVRSHVNLTGKRSLQVLWSLMFFTLALLLFIFSATGRMLRPLALLSQATRKVAAGDFTVRLPEGRPDELGMLMENFNHMAKELQSIEYLQKDFISNVSHEFKTPIASIQGFATLLQSPDTTPKEREEYTGIILKESQRLSRLSQNLLRLSRLEYQQRITAQEPIALDEQLRQTVLMLEPEWSAKGIQWDLKLESVTFPGDAELMQQVWINLINNAVKFSQPGGEIELSLYVSDMVKVRVRDHGIGMDEKTVAHIFERFYQGETSHSHEGSGLGLTLAKRIVELHGGALKVRSAPGQGSTFTVELPRHDPPERSPS